MNAELTTALKKYYGYDHFKTGQAEIIDAVLNGQNCLGILPTGTGKTLCYSLPTLMRGGLTLVVSPLIALMEDQAQRLNQRKKNCAVVLNSAVERKTQQEILQVLPTYNFLILSPEMLQSTRVVQALKKTRLQLAVVDEAHCLSQWGFDFRPEYLQILPTLKRLAVPKILALTATCTEQVTTDIENYLFERQPFTLVRLPVNRANIGLLVEELPDEATRFAHLEKLLSTTAGPGIIYCNTRKKTEELSADLNARGYQSSFYHGGLTSFERTVLQNQFKANQLQLMIATNAFGMGIDKDNLRFVIHYEMPGALESYVQEIGRAGRDGTESFALLYYVAGDERIHWHFAKMRAQAIDALKNKVPAVRTENKAVTEFWQKKVATQRHPEAVIDLLTQKETVRQSQQQTMLDYIHTTTCLRDFIASYFADPKPTHPNKCCQNDGLTLDLYAQPQTVPVPAVIEMTWQERLNLLFS